MAVNRSGVRRDLPYLRRRVKPVPDVAAPVSAPVAVTPAAPAAPAGVPTSAAPRGVGLDLRPGGGGAAASAPSVDRAGAAAASTRPRPAAGPQPFPAPAVGDVRELDDDSPVVRLDARQSAIGSLIVSGATAIAWEASDLVTGAATAAASRTVTGVGGDVTGTPVFTSGNRALVGFDGGDAIVSLRHLAQLRRALFIGDASQPLSVQLFDGRGFTVSTGDGSRMFILTLLRVGNLIELRAEPVARALAPVDIHRGFGFELTHPLATREPRRR